MLHYMLHPSSSLGLTLQPSCVVQAPPLSGAEQGPERLACV